MTTMKATDVRMNFSDTLNRVAYAGERIVLERGNKPIAVIVSTGDMELLQAIEDRIDLVKAKEALAETKAEGSTAWDDFMQEMEL